MADAIHPVHQSVHHFRVENASHLSTYNDLPGYGFAGDIKIWELMTGYAGFFHHIPTMKTIKTGNEEKEAEKDDVQEAVEKAKDAFEGAAKAGAAAAAVIGAELASKISEKLEALGAIDFSKVKIEPLFEEQVDFDTFSKSDFRAVKVKDCVAVPKSTKLLQFTLDDGTGTDRTILSGIHAYYEPEELIGKTCIAITNLPPRKMMGIDSCGMLLSAIHEEEGEEKLNLLMVDPHIPAGAKLY